ncbi:Eco57I restriction-modification methylase domain-containing protein (plasmid) [Halobacterium sp. NMX12-1]|uniref:site-specific DNA-methyltransferase (adenine-specific) n=1 Tax=Halobacterium sp. NMX12-1 TaxID=3166650 RepID=A0AAU8CGX6_9EURY
MKGHVPTPPDLAEHIVKGLFEDAPPHENDRILYPGAGTAPFAAAVERICRQEDWPVPNGYGVELDPKYLAEARERDLSHVEFDERDYLVEEMLEEDEFEYIVGNPPYVPIEELDDDEKTRYKSLFETATGRFDLYLLFFEQSLELLAPGGRLSFITPEKFEYVDTAAPLRRLLTNGGVQVDAIEHVAEDAFDGLVTFPCVTTLQRDPVDEDTETHVTLRDGTTHTTTLPADGESWAASIRGADLSGMETGATLGDVTVRISPGMATGADSLFVCDRDEVPPQLKPEWVYPTVSGSELTTFDGPRTDSVFICPYREDGSLPGEDELGAFRDWASLHREELEDRSCVQKQGEAWYGWHETPPMEDLLQPKIVFKDIAKEPRFWAEREGDVVPRHTVYYLIPQEGVPFDDLLKYLNSPKARAWIEANCQKAANGFLRLQSRVLEDLPVPKKWAETYQATL